MYPAQLDEQRWNMKHVGIWEGSGLATNPRIILPGTLNPDCEHFLHEMPDGTKEYRERLNAVALVHTVVTFGVALSQRRHRIRKRLFPRNPVGCAEDTCIVFPANADGLVVFKDRGVLPIGVVHASAVALYGRDAVSAIQDARFTVCLPDNL